MAGIAADDEAEADLDCYLMHRHRRNRHYRKNPQKRVNRYKRVGGLRFAQPLFWPDGAQSIDSGRVRLWNVQTLAHAETKQQAGILLLAIISVALFSDGFILWLLLVILVAKLAIAIGWAALGKHRRRARRLL